MNRFLLFAGQSYYAAGGFNDFIGDFDSKEEALEAFQKDNERLHGMEQHDWYQIVDTLNETIYKHGDSYGGWRFYDEQKRFLVKDE